MLDRLKEFQSKRGRFPNGRELTSLLQSNNGLRKEIEILSDYFLNKPVSGCSNCYADAFIQLMILDIKTAEKKSNCPFELKRGKLLKDVVNRDRSLYLTQANITTDLALYHLKTNPSCKSFFSKLPEDWEQLVENFEVDEKEVIKPVLSSNSKIKSLLIGGKPVEIEGGDSEIEIEFEEAPEIMPEIIIEPEDERAKVEIIPAKKIPGTTTITVIAEDETTTHFSVIFSVKETLPEFNQAEEAVIADIVKMLSEKTTITDIKAKYSDVEKIGDEKLTGVLLDKLIKEAKNRIEK